MQPAGPAALGSPELLDALSALLRRIPCTPRSLLALALLGAVAYVASRHPHLHHGPHTGLPEPELLLTGLTSHALWDRYRLHLSMGGQHSEVTIDQYQWIWSDWCIFLHGLGCGRKRCPRDPSCRAKPWHRAGPRELERYVRRPVRKGRRAGEPLSDSTRAQYIAAIGGVYAYAAEQGIITRNPMVSVRPPRVRDSIPRDFLPEQLGAIIARAKQTSDRIHVLCWLGFHGLRVAEMAIARVGDCTLAEHEPGIIVYGKGSKERFVPFQPAFVPILRDYIAGRPASSYLIERHGQAWAGKPLTRQYISDLLGDFFHEVCEMPDGHAHRLRHTAATTLLNVGKGTNLEHVRIFLGHEDSKTTRRYTKRHPWDVAYWVRQMPHPETGERPPSSEPEPVGDLIIAVLRQLLTDPDTIRRINSAPADLWAALPDLLPIVPRIEPDVPAVPEGGMPVAAT